MKQDDDKPIPCLLELKDEININSNKWTLKTIRQTERDLYSIICQLKNVHNSKLKIHKLNPDILYHIFTMVIYQTRSPLRTSVLLRLSHVCHHWRQSALGWPVLWAFLDLYSPPAIFDLFLERSQDAPLTLLLHYALDDAPSKSFFVHHANHILSRLSDLIHSGLLPLQLRHFDIQLWGSSDTDTFDQWPALISHLTDGSCLQGIALNGLDLPWLELELKNITHLTLARPETLPTPSQFLVTLSNCRFLRVLELDFIDYDNFGRYGIKSIATSTSPPSINKLVLNLTRLKLRGIGPLSCEFIQRISERVQTSRMLSSFQLDYTVRPSRVISVTVPTWPFPVPPGTFAHFSKCRVLWVDLVNVRYDESRMRFSIRGYTSVEWHRPCPLKIRCEGLPSYSLILELVHAMPEIRHLRLLFEAWEILTPKNLDARKAFPYLHTLELVHCTTEGLDSLPIGLQLKTLVLHSCTISSEALFDVVLRLNAKVLDLVDTNADDLEQCASVISTLRKRGVCVVKRNSPNINFRF